MSIDCRTDRQIAIDGMIDSAQMSLWDMSDRIDVLDMILSDPDSVWMYNGEKFCDMYAERELLKECIRQGNKYVDALYMEW